MKNIALIFGMLGIIFTGLSSAAVIKKVPAGSIIVDGDARDWAKEGVTAAKGLIWRDSFSKPLDKKILRIKSVLISYDESNFYLLFYMNPGVREYFERMQRSGSIAYIFVDSDNSDKTGVQRGINDKYTGYDYRIHISTGFSGTAGTIYIRPFAEYKIERIKKFILKKTQYGDKYDCEYEDVYQGDKSSQADEEYISFKEGFLELRFPFDLLNIKLPINIKLVIRDISSFPHAETELVISPE